jgi:hypothetical protein
MALDLQQPDDAAEAPELRKNAESCAVSDRDQLLSAIDQAHALIDAFVDQLVEEQRKAMPNVPPQMLRALLMREECPCRAGRRLAEQPA